MNPPAATPQMNRARFWSFFDQKRARFEKRMWWLSLSLS
jgi:hypothetical protein